MTAQTINRPGHGLYVMGREDGDVITGAHTSDFLIGHHGADIFEFSKGGGHDYVVGFEDGVDKLHIHGSIRQVSLRDTDQGAEVYFGRFGQGGPDHFLVVHVHNLDLSDFIFTA